ncbi:MAG: RDD family protein [Phycisphaerae bacterium]|nr:RDD family protein [Phycisphaerae bacterium]
MADYILLAALTALPLILFRISHERLFLYYLGFPQFMGNDVITIVAACAGTVLFLVKDGFYGQSPGKALTGVQVVNSRTLEPIGPWQSFLRNLVLLVPLVGPVLVAGTMIGGKRWGDGWAGTRVIWKKYRHRPVFDPRGIYCLNCGYDLTGNVSGRCPECFTFVRPRGAQLPGADVPDAADAPIERLTDA